MKPNIKKTIISLLVCLATFPLLAEGPQEEYKNAVKDYFEANNNQVVANMSSSISKLTPYAIRLANLPESAHINSEFCEKKYLSEAFLDDYIDIILPYFYKQGITVTDLKTVAMLCKSPAFTTANQHANTIIESDMEKAITECLLPAAMQIYSGQEPNDLQASAPEKYVVKFNDYYKLSGIENVVKPLLQLSMEELEKQKISKEIIDKFLQYMEKNFNIMAVNMFYGKLTMEDIDAYLSVCKTNEYTKIANAIKEVVGDAQSLGTSMLSKYSSWIKQEFGK